MLRAAELELTDQQQGSDDRRCGPGAAVERYGPPGRNTLADRVSQDCDSLSGAALGRIFRQTGSDFDRVDATGSWASAAA